MAQQLLCVKKKEKSKTRTESNARITKETHEAKIRPLALSVKEQQTVNVPLWAGIGALFAGAALLLSGGKRG